MLTGCDPGQPASAGPALSRQVGLDDLQRSLQPQLFHDSVGHRIHGTLF